MTRPPEILACEAVRAGSTVSDDIGTALKYSLKQIQSLKDELVQTPYRRWISDRISYYEELRDLCQLRQRENTRRIERIQRITGCVIKKGRN